MDFRSNVTQFCTPNMRVLSDSQIQTIHYAACEILARTGMHITNKEARELLYSHGAMVQGDVVRIPTRLVEQALRTVPERFILCNRDGERTVLMEGYRAYFGVNPDNPEYIDPYTHERRPFTSKDGADMAKMIDALPNFDFLLNACFSSDVHEDVADRVIIRQMIFNTRKPIGFSCKDYDSLKDIMEMAAIVAGGKEQLRHNPYMYHVQEPVSPLIHDDNAMRELMLCAEEEFPFAYYPMTMAGATAPTTNAGLLAQSHAESLTGMIIHQLTKPGAPFLYGAVPGVMDMRTSRFCYGAPELFLNGAALADIAHYFKIPVLGTAGTVDCKAVDAQAASEMAIGYLMAALSGQNMVHDTGLMDQATVTCPEILVLANEILGIVKHIMDGIYVSDETLALNEIHEALDTGNFLSFDHTMDHFREMWMPELFDRSTAKVAKNTLEEKMNAKARDIIENYQAPELDPDKKAAILELEKKWLG